MPVCAKMQFYVCNTGKNIYIYIYWERLFALKHLAEIATLMKSLKRLRNSPCCFDLTSTMPVKELVQTDGCKVFIDSCSMKFLVVTVSGAAFLMHLYLFLLR